MTWVSQAREALSKGEAVIVRPTGGSMRGRIESGQPVRITPCAPSDPRVDDVVFIRWKGNFLLHIVKDVTETHLLIGNNLGKTNGWIARTDVLGIAHPPAQQEAE